MNPIIVEWVFSILSIFSSVKAIYAGWYEKFGILFSIDCLISIIYCALAVFGLITFMPIIAEILFVVLASITVINMNKRNYATWFDYLLIFGSVAGACYVYFA